MSSSKRPADHEEGGTERIWSPYYRQYLNRFQFDNYGRPISVWSESTLQYVSMEQRPQRTSDARTDEEHMRTALEAEFEPHPNPREYFQVGRVFSIPASYRGVSSDRLTVLTPIDETPAPPRRFVVIRESKNRCDALPIVTYFGQGVAKKDVTKSDHAVVFTGKTPPTIHRDEKPSQGERGMRPEPIQIRTETFIDALSPMARLNFGRIYAIKHDYPIKPFGRVSSKHLHLLGEYFSSVWARLQRPPPRQLASIAPTENTVRPASGPSLDPSLGLQVFQDYQSRIDPQSFFVFGRVFTVLWTEELGGKSVFSGHDVGVVKDPQGRDVPVRQRTRHFVVIFPAQTGVECSALPIHTYRTRGVAEKGVRKSDHSIIHTTMPPPEQMEIERPGRKEAGMRPAAVRVVTATRYMTLDPSARLNYGMVTSIRLDRPVKNFGVVHPDSYAALWGQFRNVQVANYTGLAESPLPPGLTMQSIHDLQIMYANAERTGNLRQLVQMQSEVQPAEQANPDFDEEDDGEEEVEEGEEEEDDDEYAHSDDDQQHSHSHTRYYYH